jgi:hypothetical protein
MELLAAHWHCVLPLVGIAAWLLCTARDPNKITEGGDHDVTEKSVSEKGTL